MSARTDFRDDRTTVSLYEDTWSRLNARKRPGDSMDDVVNRLLNETEESTDSEGSE